ncbi:helix-turn-helix transcriptional regulator [Streptococcus halichoeri]|uniref:helix-turn-helix transcriptional regulator n=1 Tax=Streptococcus halichoeri TaxID=254785 RepID=UPI001C8E3B25|nr:helix-turn-helix transcriptional regulator [Streptococcus halichoeri]
MTNEIKPNIRKLRRDTINPETNKMLTQEELAQKIGVTKLTIARWENGERVPKSDKAKQLADYFEVPVSYLLGYDDGIDPNKPFTINYSAIDDVYYKPVISALKQTQKNIQVAQKSKKELAEKSKYFDYAPFSQRLTKRLDWLHGDIIELISMLDRYPKEELTDIERQSLANLYEYLKFFINDIPATYDFFEKSLYLDSDKN